MAVTVKTLSRPLDHTPWFMCCELLSVLIGDVLGSGHGNSKFALPRMQGCDLMSDSSIGTDVTTIDRLITENENCPPWFFHKLWPFAVSETFTHFGLLRLSPKMLPD